ncbi:hypothetical protein DH2020_003563 [Rehmannia glutinosa]|uniref:superoxide dismutase n=1 Tax=Rehmannia glutinosa TaxID=99300 RepID=A0ABR0XLZ7_REHGL
MSSGPILAGWERKPKKTKITDSQVGKRDSSSILKHGQHIQFKNDSAVSFLPAPGDFRLATLNDSFLADLDELSDNEDDLRLVHCSFFQEFKEADNDNAEHMEEDIDGDLADIEALNYDDLDSVSKLQKLSYTDIMQKVEDALEKGSDNSSHGIVLEDDPEYQLIVDCNALSVDIENEIVIIHNFIRDKYRLKFPELESLVHHPIDYARVVKKIGNEVDLTLVDLEGLLPSAIIMVVSVTASTTSGKPLPEDVLQKTVDACDRALALDSAKKKVLDFVESRMGYIAPNLSAIVGSAVAAKLMGTAGGLSSLAKMPACNVQLLGAKRKNLAGFSTATSQFRVGYLEQTEIFQSTPPSLRMRACRLLAAKSTLAARVDSTRGDPTGKLEELFAEIHKKIEKWQEPPPAKQPKPLPVPDSEPKRREVVEGDGLGEGYGMLGQAGNGKLRVSVGQSRLAAKVAKKFKERSFGSSGATSGLTSSLAFTPVQVLASTSPPSKTLKSSVRVRNLGWGERRDNMRNNRRVSKVVAYYGLKNPPYRLDALEPYMSQRTLEVHWGAHHRGYVEALNKQLAKNDILYGCTMDELIRVTYNNGNPLPEFNNAAQVWNHDFFWESMQPGGGEMPTLGILQQIEKDFASFANFKEKFIEAALTSFGSGWVWLVCKSSIVVEVIWADSVTEFCFELINSKTEKDFA